MFLVRSVIVLNAGGSLLRLLEPLVLAVRAVLVLDHGRGLRHLLPVQILEKEANGSFRNCLLVLFRLLNFNMILSPKLFKL